MNEHAASVASAGPRQLAHLMGLEATDAGDWRSEELGAILRHQLDAPVAIDLAVPRGTAWAPSAPASASSGTLGTSLTFAELFERPDPPTQLLRMVKDFAKANCCHPASVLPEHVATLLYYASIVAARLHAHDNISLLSDEELRAGISWVLDQTWVDERTRRLFAEALRTLPASV